MNKAIQRCPHLKALFYSLQTLMSRLKGNNSTKRKTLLQQKCQENNIPFRAAKILVKTRWNHTRDLGRRYLEIEPAITSITDADFGPARSDDSSSEEPQESWEDLKESARNYRQLLVFIMPYLDDVSRWTQILSSRYFLTISKIRLCYYSLSKKLQDLWQKDDDEIQSISLKSKIESAIDSLDAELLSYLGPISGYPLFLIAELLDPQMFSLLNSEKMKSAFENCEVFCSEEDYFSPKEIDD
jgi:hypothetical protein